MTLKKEYTKNNQISLRMSKPEANILNSISKKLGLTNTATINKALLLLHKTLQNKKPLWTPNTKLNKQKPKDSFKGGVLSIKNVSHE